MSYKFEEGKDLIIEAVIAKINQKMSSGQALLCSQFVRQFFSTTALDDLQEWTIDDLYGAAISFWSFIQHRAPNETKIHIYSPEYERHGWQTTHTVIEIITDDMPFLVDTIRMALNRMGMMSYLVIHMGGLSLMRDKERHTVNAVLPRGSKKNDSISIEAAIFIEIERQTNPTVIQNIHQTLENVLKDNRAVVEDWELMREKVREAVAELDNAHVISDPAEAEETKAFLNWIEDHHFTFLGVQDFDLVQKDGEAILQSVPGTGLGISREELSPGSDRNLADMTPEVRELTLSRRAMIMFKTITPATVHRQACTDYIGIKRFNEEGKVIGERRIVGLYTSAAYNTNPRHIPFLRHKVTQIMNNSGLNPKGHAGKVLLNILETFPRDDLIQAPEDELLEIAMGIYYMQERRRIRMFARIDPYHRFVSCLVYVPKDRFTTNLRESIEKILAESFNAEEITFSTWFSESVLARIHFNIRINPKNLTVWDLKEIEQKLIEVGRSWTDDLHEYVFDTFGEEAGNRIFNRFKNAFPVNYCDNFSARTAVYDLKHVEALSPDNPMVMNFYKPLDEMENSFRLKIYQHDNTVPLSDVLPIIERLGMRAISERPYVLKFGDDKVTYINDFSLLYTQSASFDMDEIKDLFQNAFASVWMGEAENDGFNQLVLAARLSWRQVAVLRTYSKYFRQIGFTFSQEYIEIALNNNPMIAKLLIQLFEIRFDPMYPHDREEDFKQCVDKIYNAVDDVASLDEDRIIRQFVEAISATLRTNYYQSNPKGKSKPWLALKLNSKMISRIPKPVPMFEIFMSSPRFEGVHLRGGKVARGGIRWSDRREDFRTEILGLMKAQQVKNAVIVPSGAKGGFVPKRLPVNGSREEIFAEGVACYQEYIRALLDITDNYQDSMVVKPNSVVCYDDDDPYLVVAADKGTATFSDIANEIALENGFWLGDAFASGGSVGYDHKKMGITARGAWESVQRHFYEINFDLFKRDFTVVGIGDMSGDVFGNGMLLSKHIKLVAAFNHQHIFIDPNPDTNISFNERERLFKLPRSSWSDYDKKLISAGGGVFNRNAKSVSVSKEMKKIFDINASSVEPNELIRAVLSSPVDLLWSAGIGTFVKAESESHADAGDKTNDNIRIDARQMRCKVVGEGGNLGLTQLARIEYAINGGLIYTDFIDNSAGVSCSDKEVNIKILLNSIVAAGNLSLKQRNDLLGEMTDEVAALVLRENFVQTRAISLTSTQGLRAFELQLRYINELESAGKIDRAVEFIADDKVLIERKLQGIGIPKPAIAVLLCYSKTILKEQILASNVPEEIYFRKFLINYFPKPLQENFKKDMAEHPLRREIIATKLSNIVINEMGFTFVYRMQEETGAPVSAIIRAYMIVRAVFDIESVWKQIERLEAIITAEKQTELVMMYVRLLRRLTRWFLRHRRMRLSVTKAVKKYLPGIQEFKHSLPAALGTEHHKLYDEACHQYLELGIDPELAHELTLLRPLFSAMDVIEVANQLDISVSKVAEVYFAIGEFLELGWIRTQVIAHPTDNNWESLSREALRDDIDWQHRQLTVGIIRSDSDEKDYLATFNEWSESHTRLIERWRDILIDLKASSSLNYTMFFVAIRELSDLTQTTLQMAEHQVEL